MSLYMLRPGWQGTFRRSIRDRATGEILRTVEFQPRVPVEISAAEIGPFESDIGRAIVPVEIDGAGVIRILFDDLDEAEEPEKKTTPRGEVKKTTPKGGKPKPHPKDSDESA